MKPRILVVDDEEHIVEPTRAMLQSLGYEVFTARSGIEAIETVKRQKDKIGLMMLDMIMPGMSGNETFVKVKQISPSLKVLLCSGYSIDGQAREILDCGCDGFIQKPYTMEQLGEKVNAILCGCGKVDIAS